ncbi:MAG: PHP domain-containing protein [Armatimonadetes bacterium]|nr:PHP domain-containing protein [Armatimonadota bacterium]
MGKGLAFRSVDLHIHTPASKCFADKTVTPEQVVEAAVGKGLAAIAITDHNTGEWIDKVRSAVAGSALAVFPGVEITVAPGVHVVALFDIDRDTEYVNGLLAALGIKPDERGKPETLCSKTLEEVSKTIRDWGGLVVFAHCDGPKGVFRELNGQTRIATLNAPWYDAVETTGPSLPADFDKGHGFSRIPACYQISDNPDASDPKKHSLDGIGLRRCWMRLDSDLRLESLRQCFIDPSVRIMPMDWTPQDAFPRILSMNVVGGFLDGQQLYLNDSLNSIFGGKGAGKSLIIEFMRFALGQPSNEPTILADHRKKVDKCLGPSGHVELQLLTAAGVTYALRRATDGSVTCTDTAASIQYQGHIPELFPILAYSQTEIIEIAKDTRAQLLLTDSFVDVPSHQRKIAQVQAALDQNDKDLGDALAAATEVTEIIKEAETYKGKIRDIDTALAGGEERAKLRAAFETAKQKKNAFGGIEQDADGVKELITAARDDIKGSAAEETAEEDPDLKWATDSAAKARSDVREKLDAAIAIMESHKSLIEARRASWMPQYNAAEKAYAETLVADEKKLNEERAKAEEELSKLEKRISQRKARAAECGKLQTERTESLDALDRLYDDLYNERATVYADLAKQSGRKLRLEVKHSTDSGQFQEQLKELVTGSRVKGDYIEDVGEKLSPRRFVDLVLTKDAAGLAAEAGIPETTADTMVSRLMSAESLQPLLRLQHGWYPQDEPTIKFRKDSGSYATLDELSVGQKCTALLIIALSRGERPIIIDQPEDALDIKTVWEDVAQKLRQNKTQRQFILTTHNNTVAVSSDTDMMIHVESDSTSATVRCLGGIECAQEPALQVLEGGREPYILRKSKYNLS